MYILIVTLLICQLAVLLGVFAWLGGFKRRLSYLQDSLRAFFAQDNEETPSDFGLLIDKMAQAFAARFVQGVSGMIAGYQSGASKQEKQAVMDSIVQENPSLSGLMSFMPKLKRANPLLLSLAGQVLSKFTQSGQQKVASSNGEKPKFHL